MKILLTLDYELFLGERTGTIQNSLIKPTNILTSLSEKFGIKFTIFVDATYLLMLERLSSKFLTLKEDYEKIRNHIKVLNKTGHDIQLHIHPNWYFSKYQNNLWELDNLRYKLSDLENSEAKYIFTNSKAALDSIIEKKTIAYRAGGFSTQPTSLLAELFDTNGIYIDSSVYRGAYYNSIYQNYNYLNAPNKELYRFSDNICIEDLQGRFIEIPLTTELINPFFSWKLSFNKILGIREHKLLADGSSIKTANQNILSRLTRSNYSFASIDGYKISYLQKMMKSNSHLKIFTVIGHPKLITPYSLRYFEKFCFDNYKENEFITITELI